MSLKFKILVSVILAAAAWVFSAPYLAERLIVEKPLKSADAIVVLSGSSVYVERTQKAAILFRQGIAPKIILTDDGGRAGWSRTKEENPPFVQLARESLVAQGVPSDSIEILESAVDGTHSEAQAVLNKATEDGLNSILIITSAYHTRRSLWIFDKVLAADKRKTVIGIEGAITGQQTPKPFTWWLTPSGWRLVAGEYVKSIYYWMYY